MTYLVMHVPQGCQNRHHDFTSHLIFCQVAPGLGQLSIQVTPKSKLLHHIDAFLVLKSCVDLDYAWVLKRCLQLNFTSHLSMERKRLNVWCLLLYSES